MRRVFEVATETLEANLPALSDLIGRQMQVIGSPQAPTEIEKNLRAVLRPETRAHLLVCANEDRELVGFAFLNIGTGIETGGDYVWLNEIHVRQDHRRLGIGSELLQQVSDFARTKGCLRILAGTATDNTASQSLFRSSGFAIRRTLSLDREV